MKFIFDIEDVSRVAVVTITGGWLKPEWCVCVCVCIYIVLVKTDRVRQNGTVLVTSPI